MVWSFLKLSHPEVTLLQLLLALVSGIPLTQAVVVVEGILLVSMFHACRLGVMKEAKGREGCPTCLKIQVLLHEQFAQFFDIGVTIKLGTGGQTATVVVTDRPDVDVQNLNDALARC